MKEEDEDYQEVLPCIKVREKITTKKTKLQGEEETINGLYTKMNLIKIM